MSRRAGVGQRPWGLRELPCHLEARAGTGGQGGPHAAPASLWARAGGVICVCGGVSMLRASLQ